MRRDAQVVHQLLTVPLCEDAAAGWTCVQISLARLVRMTGHSHWRVQVHAQAVEIERSGEWRLLRFERIRP